MNKRRIFITEDERLVAISLERKLNGLGYQVVGMASSGQEALEKVAETTPDLILMDIQLKGNLDGIETAAQLRTKIDVPIIYLTAYDDEATLQRAKLTEPFGYLLKPYQARDLRTTIEMALYKHTTERQIKAKERWSQATLSSIGEGVITTDIHGNVTFINGVAEQLTQWAESEAVGNDISQVLTLIDEETTDTVTNPIIDAITTNQIVNLAKNTTLIAKNGVKIPIDNSIAPIIDEQGDVNGGVLVFRDITERRQLEEQLYQSKKLEALGQFTGGVAHHFNNMLTSIIGYVSFAMESLPRNHPARTDLERVLTVSQRAAALNNQLLAFTRRQDIKPTTINPNGLILTLRNKLDSLAQEGVILRLLLDPQLKLVKIDPNQFEELLINLATNACDAMPEGGCLTVETQQKSVTGENLNGDSGIPPGDYSLVIISDTGVGMSQEVRSRIFEPFFTTKPVDQATGLGLSTCLGIVRQHGGYIKIKSEPKKGAGVTVYLPSSATTH